MMQYEQLAQYKRYLMLSELLQLGLTRQDNQSRSRT